MNELPFDYDTTLRWLAGKHRLQINNIEDRYHDTLEKFIRKYDGSVHPLTAMNQYFSGWYRDKWYRVELSKISAMEDLINLAGVRVESDEGEQYIASRYDYYDQDDAHSVYLRGELLSVIEELTEYQRDILLRRVDGQGFQEIADAYGVTHQAIQNTYQKVTKKLLDILT